MNFFNDRNRLALILLVLLMSGLRAQQPAPDLTTNGETATSWSGVKLVVGEIKRLDQGHILMAVRLTSDASQPHATFIGTPPAVDAQRIAHATPAELNTPAFRPSSFSLASTTLIDQKSGTQFTASPTLPRQPFIGLTAILYTLPPSSWIQMAVQFPLPSPPVNPDGTLPIQKVDVLFPKATGPIKGVIIPPLSRQ